MNTVIVVLVVHFFGEKGNFIGCFKDDMSNPTSAKIIKDITLNQMKGDGKNDD